MGVIQPFECFEFDEYGVVDLIYGRWRASLFTGILVSRSKGEPFVADLETTYPRL
jgi:hypothetical protein